MLPELPDASMDTRKPIAHSSPEKNLKPEGLSYSKNEFSE
jgi:hypothetical protein